MNGGWARSLVAFFADVMHRLASTLDRAAGRPEPSLAVLMQRFPGAPEHWLRDIAERSPQVSPELSPPEPAPALVLPQAASRRATRLDLPGEVAEHAVPSLSLSASGPARRRVRLQFHPERRREDAEPLRLPESKRERPAPSQHEAQLPTARSVPRLRLVPRQEPSGSPDAREWTEPTQLAASDLRLANDHATRSAPPLCTSPRTVAEPAPPLSFPPQQASTPASAPALSQRKTRSLSSLSLAATQTIAAPPPRWIAALPQSHSGLRPLSHEVSWPELPGVTQSVRDECLPPPRFDELRREQEEGLWNA